MSQDNTTLSPRLLPLMIQNDRRTGTLIHPHGESSRASSLGSSNERPGMRDYNMGIGMPSSVTMPHKLSDESGLSISPPSRPMTVERERMAPPEVYHRKGSAGSRGSGDSGSPPRSAGRLLSPTEPHSRLPSYDSLQPLRERKSSNSIGHLLNHLSMSSRSPPPTSGSDHSRSASPLSGTHPHHHMSPPSQHRHLPMHPSHPAQPQMHMAYPTSPPDMHRRSVTGPIPHRPDMYRRHSAHPYEQYAPHRAQELQAYRQEFIPLGLTGSRAPISRTTKACNGCRIRKVRCDAGGGGPASEPSTCSRCREAGVPCVYSGVQKKRGPCPGTARPTLGRRKSSMNDLRPYSPTAPLSPGAAHPTSYAPGPFHSSQSYPPVQHRPSMPATWSERQVSHGRAPPPPPHHEPPRPDQVLQRKPSLFSWPNMEPAIEVDERQHRKMFPHEYSLRPPSAHSPDADPLDDKGSFFGDKGRSLPPLRMVISRPTSSYYDPM